MDAAGHTPADTSSVISGWAFSLLTHTLVVTTALSLVSMRPLPQPEPFRWDVSLIKPPLPATPVQPTTGETALARTPSQPAHRPVSEQVPLQTVTAPGTQHVAMAQPTTTLTSTQTVESLRPITQAMTNYELPPEIREVLVQERPRPQMLRSEPANETVVRQAVRSIPTPVSPSVVEATDQPVTTPQPVVSMSPRPVTAPEAQGQAPSTPGTNGADNVAPPHAPNPDSTPPSGHSRSGPPSVDAVRSSEAPAEGAPEPPALSPGSTVVSLNVPFYTATAKGRSDHQWLVDALMQRAAHFKQYPRLARMHGWQGRVVIRVVINEDGSLTDANVVESSGYDLLDLDAIGLVKKVCPIELQRELGQSHVVINVPVSYSLTVEQ